MAYCGGATQSNADYLASKTGLSPAVALAWLKNECQSNPNPTNPLNILYYGTNGQTGKNGRFGTYASTHAGLDAAARLVNGSAYYSIIRLAIKTRNPWAEAHAIELSPWAGGHYGGSSTHYGGIVRTLQRIIGGAPPAIGSGGSGTTGPTPHPSPDSTPVSSTTVNPFNWSLSRVLTTADLKQLEDWILAKTPAADQRQVHTYLNTLLFGVPDDNVVGNNSYVGKTYADLLAAAPGLFTGKGLTAGGVGAPTDPITAVANAIGGLGDVLGKLAGFGVAMVLIGFGVFLYSKSIRTRVEIGGASGVMA